MLLEAVARRSDFRPVACGDGRTALKRLEQDDFAVILLDLGLPEVDGFAVLEHLSLHAPHLLARVIVLTGLAQARLRSCAQLKRVWRVVRKPFELRVLQEQIVACSAGRRTPAP